MKTLLIPLIAGMLFLTSCNSHSSAKDKGAETSATHKDNANKNSYPRVIRKLVEGASGRLSDVKVNEQTIEIKEYLPNQNGTLSYQLKKDASDSNRLFFTIKNPVSKQVKVHFVPFSQHPQLVFDSDEMNIVFGVMELTTIPDGGISDASTKSYKINIPINSLLSNGMQFIVEAPQVADTMAIKSMHRHIQLDSVPRQNNPNEEIKVNIMQHQRWHKVNDPRKGD
jgi:hypothetical protein